MRIEHTDNRTPILQNIYDAAGVLLLAADGSAKSMFGHDTPDFLPEAQQWAATFTLGIAKKVQVLTGESPQGWVVMRDENGSMFQGSSKWVK